MGQESPHACPGGKFLLSYLGSCDLQTAYLPCVTEPELAGRRWNPGSATVSYVTLGKLFKLSEPEVPSSVKWEYLSPKVVRLATSDI